MHEIRRESMAAARARTLMWFKGELYDIAAGWRPIGGESNVSEYGKHFDAAVAAPSGRYLLSAGWVWGPYSCLAVYDLHRALVNPATLDRWTSDDVCDGREFLDSQVSGACFVGDDIVLSTTEPNTLLRWDLAARAAVWRRELDRCAGDLIPLHGHVLAVHEHPVLYDATTGEQLAEWPDLPTGDSLTSVVEDGTFSGPNRIAVDPTTPRFAHTDGETVTIVHLGP